MKKETEAARNIVYKGAQTADEGESDPGLMAMAKYYFGKTAVHCANEALHIYGGYG